MIAQLSFIDLLCRDLSVNRLSLIEEGSFENMTSLCGLYVYIATFNRMYRGYDQLQSTFIIYTYCICFIQYKLLQNSYAMINYHYVS